MSKVGFSELALNRSNLGNLLCICASDGGFYDLTLNRAVGVKHLGLCASEVEIGKSALNCACLGSGDLIRSCKCELSKLGKSRIHIGSGDLVCVSHIENSKSALGGLNLLCLLSVCGSNLKVSKSSVLKLGIGRSHSICASCLNRCKRAIHRCNLGKLLSIRAGNSGFNDLALDRAVGFKNLGLCVSYVDIGDVSYNGSNVLCINSLSAGDMRFCYLALKSLNALNTDYIGTGDICISKSSLGSLSRGEILSICISKIKGCKLAYLITAVGCGDLLRSCKSELSKSGKVGCSICGSNLICLGKVSSGNSALGRLNVSKLLNLGASNSCFNDLALDRAVGVKHLGLCVSEINACESALNGSNLVCLACICKMGLIRLDRICVSKLGFCIVTILGLNSLGSLLICVSKLNLGKVKGYCRGSFLYYLGKICLDNHRKIVVLDDLRHITVVILLLGLSHGLGFYIIINNIRVCERFCGSFCNGRLCLLILIVGIIVAHRLGSCSIFCGYAIDIIVDDYNVCNDNSCTGSNLCNDSFYAFLLGSLLSNSLSHGSFCYGSIGYGRFFCGSLVCLHVHKRKGDRNSAGSFSLGGLFSLDAGDDLGGVSILKDKRCSGTKTVFNIGCDPILKACAAIDEVLDLLDGNLTLLAYVNTASGKVSGDSRVKLSLGILGCAGDNFCAVSVLVDSGIETEGLFRLNFTIGIVIAYDSGCLLCGSLAVSVLVYRSGNYVNRVEHRTLNRIVFYCGTGKLLIEGLVIDHVDLGIGSLLGLSLLSLNLLGLCLLGRCLCYGRACRLRCLFLALKALLNEIVEGTSSGSISFYSLKLSCGLFFFLSLILGLGDSLSLSYGYSLSLGLGNGGSLLCLISLLSCIVDRRVVAHTVSALFLNDGCRGNILEAGSLIVGPSAGDNSYRIGILKDERNARTNISCTDILSIGGCFVTGGIGCLGSFNRDIGIPGNEVKIRTVACVFLIFGRYSTCGLICHNGSSLGCFSSSRKSLFRLGFGNLCRSCIGLFLLLCKAYSLLSISCSLLCVLGRFLCVLSRALLIGIGSGYSLILLLNGKNYCRKVNVIFLGYSLFSRSAGDDHHSVYVFVDTRNVVADDLVSVLCFLACCCGRILFLSAALVGAVGRSLVGAIGGSLIGVSLSGVSLSGLLTVNYGFLASGLFFSSGLSSISRGSSLFLRASLCSLGGGGGLIVVIIDLIGIIECGSLGCEGGRDSRGYYLCIFLGYLRCAGNDLCGVNVLEDEGSKRTESFYYLAVSILYGSLRGRIFGRSAFGSSILSCKSLLCRYCGGVFLSGSYRFLSIFSRFLSSICCSLSGICGLLSEVSRFLRGLILVILECSLGRNFLDVSFGRLMACALVCLAVSVLRYYLALVGAGVGSHLALGFRCLTVSFLSYYLVLISAGIVRCISCYVVSIGKDCRCYMGSLLIRGGILFCDITLACDYSCGIGILKDMRSKRTKVFACVFTGGLVGVSGSLACAVLCLGCGLGSRLCRCAIAYGRSLIRVVCLRSTDGLNGDGAIALTLDNLGGIMVDNDASAGCGLTALSRRISLVSGLGLRLACLSGLACRLGISLVSGLGHSLFGLSCLVSGLGRSLFGLSGLIGGLGGCIFSLLSLCRTDSFGGCALTLSCDYSCSISILKDMRSKGTES